MIQTIKKYKFFLLGSVVLFVSFLSLIGFRHAPSDNSPSKQKLLVNLLLKTINSYHFSSKDYDDQFSEALFKSFIENLDNSKMFFLKQDINELEQYKTRLDEDLFTYNFDFFNNTVQLLEKRQNFISNNLEKLLENPLSFKQKEVLVIEDSTYSANEKELLERWRKQLKYNVLSRLKNDLDKEDTLYKKALEKDSSYTKKSFAELEKNAREKVLKNYTDYFKRLNKTKTEDYFSNYLNSIALYHDPHTTYMAPKEEKEFNASMSGQLEGIGAQLSNKDGYITVQLIVPGSASWKDGRLKVSDQILEVAQDGENYVNIVGMPLDEAVDLIRGKKDTKVRLSVKQADGAMKEIVLTRDVVEFEETFARSSVVEKNGKKYGVIYLPKFYINFENKDGREASSDVKKEIELLKKENVDGIILDLRNNMGGALQGAVRIAGLFIDKGPVVQTKVKSENAKILEDKESGAVWEGPLVVLQNELSASASEILAGALKDYNRAVIVGTKSSFGKGTVQSMIELDNFIPISPDTDRTLGAIKLTIEKFYRINGSSTQLKGVPSDVILPDIYSALDVSENGEKFALEWDSIDAAKYKALERSKINKVVQKSQKRVDTTTYFNSVKKNIDWIKKRKDEKNVPLSYEQYTKYIEEYKKETKDFENLLKLKDTLIFSAPSWEKEAQIKDSVFALRRKQWYGTLNKDAAVIESVRILEDLNEK